MEVTRRVFLSATGSAALAAAAVEEKVFDGGLAPVTLPGEPVRATPLVPAGATGWAAFKRKCVGCGLCVAACPYDVLRLSSKAGRLFLPEMSFVHGYCGLYCRKCGEACPTGAIVPLAPEARRHVHIGKVVFHAERCLATNEGATCDACVRHCPVKALYLVPRDPAHPDGPLVPVADAEACIGCGACEHVCPARPLPGFTVEGHAVHRVVRKMEEAEACAEARRILKEGKASVVALREGVFTAHALGRGIKPLIDLYDEEPEALRGATVVDRVVGRAAAAVCVLAGVKRVQGLLASEGAVTFLAQYRIPCTAETRVERILNRAQTGMCPMECAVQDLTDPAKMLEALRKALGRQGT